MAIKRKTSNFWIFCICCFIFISVAVWATGFGLILAGVTLLISATAFIVVGLNYFDDLEKPAPDIPKEQKVSEAGITTHVDQATESVLETTPKPSQVSPQQTSELSAVPVSEPEPEKQHILTQEQLQNILDENSIMSGAAVFTKDPNFANLSLGLCRHLAYNVIEYITTQVAHLNDETIDYSDRYQQQGYVKLSGQEGKYSWKLSQETFFANAGQLTGDSTLKDQSEENRTAVYDFFVQVMLPKAGITVDQSAPVPTSKPVAVPGPVEQPTNTPLVAPKELATPEQTESEDSSGSDSSSYDSDSDLSVSDSSDEELSGSDSSYEESYRLASEEMKNKILDDLQRISKGEIVVSNNDECGLLRYVLPADKNKYEEKLNEIDLKLENYSTNDGHRTPAGMKAVAALEQPKCQLRVPKLAFIYRDIFCDPNNASCKEDLYNFLQKKSLGKATLQVFAQMVLENQDKQTTTQIDLSELKTQMESASCSDKVPFKDFFKALYERRIGRNIRNLDLPEELKPSIDGIDFTDTDNPRVTQYQTDLQNARNQWDAAKGTHIVRKKHEALPKLLPGTTMLQCTAQECQLDKHFVEKPFFVISHAQSMALNAAIEVNDNTKNDGSTHPIFAYL